MGAQPEESGRFTRIGADMGYKAAGEEGERVGAKSNECKNDRSDEVMEEMSVSVDLEMAFSVNIVNGGGTRLSHGSEDVASSCSSSASLFRSAD